MEESNRMWIFLIFTKSSNFTEKICKTGRNKYTLFCEMMIFNAVLIRKYKARTIANFCVKDVGLIILPTAEGVLADFWVPNEIDRLNFQHKYASF